MLDLENMINAETGNKLAFCKPNIYVELDENDEIVASWNDMNKALWTSKNFKLENTKSQREMDVSHHGLSEDYGGFPSHW